MEEKKEDEEKERKKKNKQKRQIYIKMEDAYFVCHEI
jgi:hypothetical protein